MAINPEREQETPVSGIVKEIPKVPEIPPELERTTGVQTVTGVAGTVTDDQGQPLASPPADQQNATTVPASQVQLTQWSKGSSTDALTWLATFWLRFIKKAVHFGWNVVNQGGGK